MKTKYLFIIALAIFVLTSCGDDKDDPNDNQPTGEELSIEPYFKYVGMSINIIQDCFSTPLEGNDQCYYLQNQWIYNQRFNVVFWLTTQSNCSTVRLKRSDEKTTTFEHFKFFSKEAFLSLGEPKYIAIYKQLNTDGSDKEMLYEAKSSKKGNYEQAITFAEKNNISKIGHFCEMVWQKNNREIKYYFSTFLSEVYITFNIDIT